MWWSKDDKKHNEDFLNAVRDAGDCQRQMMDNKTKGFEIVGGEEEVIRKPMYSFYDGKKTGVYRHDKDTNCWSWYPERFPITHYYLYGFEDGIYYDGFDAKHLELISNKLKELNNGN